MLDDNWAIVGHAANDGLEELYNTLRSHNIKPKEFMLYGDIRTFIRANGLPEDKAIAFHMGDYIGNVKDVEKYIEVMKIP